MGTGWGNLFSGLIGAILGGCITSYFSFRLYQANLAKLEASEIRRLKVECLSNLIGLRFVTPSPSSQLPEFISKWMFEMNRICVLWADDARVMTDLRDLNADSKDTARLIKVLRAMGAMTKFPLENLSDADLGALFMLPIAPIKLSDTSHG